MRFWGILLAALGFFVLGLPACSPGGQQADPALWIVEDGQGNIGWLFGTVHSSPQKLAWESPPVHAALAQAGEIMVEVGNLDDEAAVGATFAQLAVSADQPPLSRRVDRSARPALAALLKQTGYGDGDFARMDTWAAALTLANAGADKADARNGVDRAVIARASGRPVVELEGASRQLGLFDALPESEQRDLLTALVEEAAEPDRDLADSWRKGDMIAVERETQRGLLADPELREVLFSGRNRDWAGRIAQAIRARRKPFVAVGAAHMAGPDGLPAMLGKQGFTVTRTRTDSRAD